MSSPDKFIKPADLFKMRRIRTEEPPSPMKSLTNIHSSPVKLPGLLKNPFQPKRKLQLESPVKKRPREMIQMDEDANLDWKRSAKKPQPVVVSPSKTISKEAPVYQHPYFSWQKLYPRRKNESSKNHIPLTKHPEAVSAMHRDWCESLNDLTDQLVADYYNILFNHQRALISPLSYGMSLELKKLGITLDDQDDSGIENDDSLDKDLDLGEDENDGDASQFLESLGWSQQELHKDFLQIKMSRSSDTTDSSSRSISGRTIATIEGLESVKKLSKFLQTNKVYTLSNLGEFAGIPPTLLAPTQFKYSTLTRNKS